MALVHGIDTDGYLVALLLDADGKPIIYGVTSGGATVPVLLAADGTLQIAGTVSADLNAGSNIIGKVDVNSLPTLNVNLNAGSNIIGKVDINTIPTTTVQGTNSDKLDSLSAVICSQSGSSDLAAGTNTFTFLACPSGYFYRVTSIAVLYNGTTSGVKLRIQITHGGVDYAIGEFNSISSGTFYIQVYNVPMQYGDSLKFTVSGATIHDSSYIQVVGYSQHTT
jgi:hypothetical protein